MLAYCKSVYTGSIPVPASILHNKNNELADISQFVEILKNLYTTYTLHRHARWWLLGFSYDEVH